MTRVCIEHQVTASVSEANASRDLIEKLRLEIAEST